MAMAEASFDQTARWPVVQTDAGPVTLASADDLQARANQWRAWAGQAAASAQALRLRAEDSLARGGRTLVDHAAEWPVPTELQSQLDEARALSQEVASDDVVTTVLKGQEQSGNVLTRIGARHHEHQVAHERDRTSSQLRELLVSMARSAPPTTVGDAEAERRNATDLESQATALDAQIKAAEGWASACDAEVARRHDAIKAMGFDSLYEAARLQTSGAEPVDSPLVLKAGEKAYISVPATLARMVSRTRYVGRSSGFSFPIGHTGIRYRVGSFNGQPVHQELLSKIDAGTLVGTNQRIAYIGRAKSTSVALGKVLHVEIFNDAISIAHEGRENPDFFLLSNPKHVVFLLNWCLSAQARS
jgi:hypothetical protein